VRDTLGHDVDDRFGPARLAGWRRVWNVGSDEESHPERVVYRAGERFHGVMVVLGIEPTASARPCDGAVFPATRYDLANLDIRERNYDRVDVTHEVSWPNKPADCEVHTYVPKPTAINRIGRAEGVRPVVVRRGYFTLVEEAFTEAGQLDSYRETTPAPPYPIVDLIVAGLAEAADA